MHCAVRAGYAFNDVMDMSPMQLAVISRLVLIDTNEELLLNATGHRVGANSSKKGWEEFTQQIEQRKGTE